jgi:ribosomal protein S18 acetylase RimI-like enzyme
MILLNRVAGIEYGLLQDGDFDPMARLLAEAFSLYDPPAVAVGLSSPEIHGLIGAFRDKALREQLSVVARTESEGVLVGALLAEDFGTPPPDGLADVTPNFAPIGALLEGLDVEYRKSRTVVPGSYLHLFMVGVSTDFAGRGIAHHLITACSTNGKGRGYRFAVTEATGSVSQHVFRKLGFHDVFATPYRDFRFNGQPVFSSIVGPSSTILMEREL